MTRYEIIHPTDYSEEQLEEVFKCLPEWRRAEALRYKQRQGQVECALAYHLLSEMLGFQPEFVKGEKGKPFLNSLTGERNGTSSLRNAIKDCYENEDLELLNFEPLNFNLSHCKRAVGCVVSDEGEVGIDVECLGRYKVELAEYCMSDEELRQIAEAEDKDAEFTLLWTRKEALLKFTGEGITDDLKGCLSSPRAEGVTIESGIDKEHGYAWSVAWKVKSKK